jgi:hypothetical protein
MSEKRKWVAIYSKPLSEYDPLDLEAHGYQVEAAGKEEALEKLEERWDIPWRTFLIEVIPRENLEKWIEDLNEESKRIGCDTPFILH